MGIASSQAGLRQRAGESPPGSVPRVLGGTAPTAIIRLRTPYVYR